MLERAGFKVYEKMEQDIALAINQPWFNLPLTTSATALSLAQKK